MPHTIDIVNHEMVVLDEDGNGCECHRLTSLRRQAAAQAVAGGVHVRLRRGAQRAVRPLRQGEGRSADMTDELFVHRAPFSDWYATQDGTRGVLLCDKTGNEKVKVEPPSEWGRRWRWNLVEDGSGVYFVNE